MTTPNDAPTKPPRARVEDAIDPDEVTTETGAEAPRTRDYLEGFLHQKPAETATGAGGDLQQAVIDALKEIYDPEIPVNIYDLGLIYTIDITADNAVKVIMTLTAPGCPVAGDMPGWIMEAIEPVAGVKEVDVELTWEPPWGMEMMSDEARLELALCKPKALRFACLPECISI